MIMWLFLLLLVSHDVAQCYYLFRKKRIFVSQNLGRC